MSELRVKFSGLFTVIRHIDPPSDMATGSDSTNEPITIAFVHDDGGPGGHTMAGHTGPMHQVTMHIPASALRGPGAQALGYLADQPSPDGSDLVSFSLEKWRIHLPASTVQEPVEHDRDEPLTSGEPTSTDHVGEGANWAPLTRLPTLNHLTNRPLQANPQVPDSRIDGVVVLSGGRLECVRSHKSLRDGFFEFFTEDETRLVHPAVEDVVYTRQVEGEEITLGISRISKPADVFPVPLVLKPGQEILIRSLPANDAAHAMNLNHFRNYYKLMRDPMRPQDTFPEPFVRMLGRRDDAGNLVHTMPGIHAISPQAKKDPGPFTVDTCSCFASQVYAGPLAT